MKEKGSIIFVVILTVFFGSIFYHNITTYNSLKMHTGHAVGVIVKVWDDDGSWYCRYRYTVNGSVFSGLQGDKREVLDTVLVVYDSLHPKFSMIADYPLHLIADSNNNLRHLDPSLVTYKWWDYLPGDEINSISDLWN
jgi:hypothetical protein